MAAKKGVDMDTDHIWNCDLLHRVQNSSSPDLMNKNETLTKLAELAKTEPDNFVKLTELTNTSEQQRLKIYENNCSGNQDLRLYYKAAIKGPSYRAICHSFRLRNEHSLENEGSSID